MGISANDFATPHTPVERFPFGVEATPKALRDLADRIERNEINLGSVSVTSEAFKQDFTRTILTIRFSEKLV